MPGCIRAYSVLDPHNSIFRMANGPQIRSKSAFLEYDEEKRDVSFSRNRCNVLIILQLKGG